MLDHSITIPASGEDSEFQLNLASTQGTDVYLIGYTPTITFYDHGAPVALPPGYLIGTGSVGALAFGGYVTGAAIPSITFDQIDFSATITLINNLDDQHISSAEIPASAPSLEYIVFSPTASPAPEPAAWASMILGFGVLGLRLRRRAAPGGKSVRA